MTVAEGGDARLVAVLYLIRDSAKTRGFPRIEA
jgi:hypothetical protein